MAPLGRLWAYLAGQPPTSTELAADRLLVGRGDHCNMRLDDPTVSWDHLELTRSGDALLARDLQSRNGTLLNGQRFEGSVRLRDADTLTVGSVRLVLTLTKPHYESTRRVDLSVPHLTDDERQVARALVQNYRRPGQLAARPATRAEIAAELHLGERTVQRRLDVLATKLRVRDASGRDRPLLVAQRILELGLDA